MVFYSLLCIAKYFKAIAMEQQNQPLEDIRIIKKIMEESSRFLSLSGLALPISGIFALAGAVAAHMIIPKDIINGEGYSE